MATYTVPLFYSPTALIALKPGVYNSLGLQTPKVLAPFELGLWLMIVLIIILTALLLTRFSGKSEAHARNAWRFTGRQGQGGDKPKWLDCAIWGLMGLDACIHTGTYFFSTGIKQYHGVSFPANLLLFLLGTFILMVVSTYVANLTVFLTQKNIGTSGPPSRLQRRDGKYVCCPQPGKHWRWHG